MSLTKHRLILLALSLLGLVLDPLVAFKVPFRVKDVLPVFPCQVSWPILNNIHNTVNLLPYFVRTVAPGNGTIKWKGGYFYENEVRLDFTDGDLAEDPRLGGGIIYLNVLIYA